MVLGCLQLSFRTDIGAVHIVQHFSPPILVSQSHEDGFRALCPCPGSFDVTQWH